MSLLAPCYLLLLPAAAEFESSPFTCAAFREKRAAAMVHLQVWQRAGGRRGGRPVAQIHTLAHCARERYACLALTQHASCTIDGCGRAWVLGMAAGGVAGPEGAHNEPGSGPFCIAAGVQA